jgi:general secretion pathway protein I
MTKRRCSMAGFTLLELMIALVIFAVTALVVLEQTSRSVRLQSVLEEKTLALWVAENTIAKLQQEKAWPSPRSRHQKVHFADRDWRVNIHTENTAQAKLRKVTVDVAIGDETERKVASLVGYLGKS